jgi:hypothetical protein
MKKDQTEIQRKIVTKKPAQTNSLTLARHQINTCKLPFGYFSALPFGVSFPKKG